MSKLKSIFFIFIATGYLAGMLGCAEKKTRIWIEPPVGLDSDQATAQKLYYQVEDSTSGKKENLIIPIRQAPDHLVVEDHQKGAKSGLGDLGGMMDEDLARATQADKQIQEGKLSISSKKGAPTVSYLRGLSEVERLYQKKLYSEALVKIAPMIEEYPQQTRLLVMQGTLFRKIGEKKLALDAYQKAKGADGKNPEVEEAIAKLQDEMGSNL